jgi:serine/threonine protein kinase
MLEREVEIMKSLNHVSGFPSLLSCCRMGLLQPHIARYEDYFEDGDMMYIVMECESLSFLQKLVLIFCFKDVGYCSELRTLAH